MKKITITQNEVKTQTGAIMWHLKTYGHITTWEAIQQYGATRLASIICNLRKNDYDIQSVIQETINRFNRKTKIVKYIYTEPKTTSNLRLWD